MGFDEDGMACDSSIQKYLVAGEADAGRLPEVLDGSQAGGHEWTLLASSLGTRIASSLWPLGSKKYRILCQNTAPFSLRPSSITEKLTCDTVNAR